MPRVVPSQVRELITAVFPPVDFQPEAPISREYSPQLASVLELTDQIPDELITLTGLEYGGYVVGKETIRHQLSMWHHSVEPRYLPMIGTNNCVAMIDDALANCPDDAPAQGTVELQFITDTALRDSIRLDISAGNRNLIEGEWKAAAVLAGAATEALLLWAIEEAERNSAGTLTNIINAMTPTPNGKDPQKWHLPDLIRVAEQGNLITAETVKQANLANDFRNLIHPGRVIRTSKAADRARALGALAAAEAVVRDIS